MAIGLVEVTKGDFMVDQWPMGLANSSKSNGSSSSTIVSLILYILSQSMRHYIKYHRIYLLDMIIGTLAVVMEIDLAVLHCGTRCLLGRKLSISLDQQVDPD